jgi:hypothetical protein
MPYLQATLGKDYFWGEEWVAIYQKLIRLGKITVEEPERGR